LDLYNQLLNWYMGARSMTQRVLAFGIVEEWAREHRRKTSQPLFEAFSLGRELRDKALEFLQQPRPAGYYELYNHLNLLRAECDALLNSFVTDCEVPRMMVRPLPTAIDYDGTEANGFSIDTAKWVVGANYDALERNVTRGNKKQLTALGDKRATIQTSITRFSEIKAEYDVRVASAYAAAWVAFHYIPEDIKVTPLVKGLMDSVKVCTTIMIRLTNVTNGLNSSKRMLISSLDLLGRWRHL
jgi:TATA-binding protein-associated factor